MKISEAVKVNKTFALYRKAKTLSASLERRADFLRSNKKLTEDGEYNLRDIQQDLNEFISRLDYNQFISQPPKWLSMAVEDVMTYAFGPCKPGKANNDPFRQAMIEELHQSSQKAKAAELTFMLQAELAMRSKAGWAFVFNTLTVAPENYEKVFRKNSDAFKIYIQNFQRSIKCGHAYFACVEEGGKFGRLHIHVLHMVETIPGHWNDPNKGAPNPTKREISAVKKLWPYGFSVPLAVRYSNNDAFSRKQWRWPLDRTTGKGMPVKPVAAVGGYVSKYILKSYTSQSRSNYLWRTRKTQTLGNELLRQLLSPLTTKQLQTVLSVETIRTKINQMPVPAGRMRQMALQILQGRQSSVKIFESLKTWKCQASLLLSAQDLTQSEQTNSPPKPGNTLTDDTSDEATCEAQNALDKSAQSIAAYYFPVTTYEHKTLSTRQHFN